MQNLRIGMPAPTEITNDYMITLNMGQSDQLKGRLNGPGSNSGLGFNSALELLELLDSAIKRKN